MRIIYGNVLLVNGKPLGPESLDGQESLIHTIRNAKEIIGSAFEEFPEVWTMHLGNEAEVFVEGFNTAAGVFDTPSGLRPRFAEIWQLFIDNNYRPRIRISSGMFDGYRGAFLLLCKPTAAEGSSEASSAKK
jgi:hypothetical protein